MDRYENLGLVGEGSYGMVLKCLHKESNQIVAIKKFIESEDDKMVKKVAMREIKMLKQLRHENLVNLLEVFRRKKRLFLVFEFVDRTILDDLEAQPNGLRDVDVKKITFQVLRGLEFCHNRNIIHRDVKPENILISKTGIVKLCDFGFARMLAIGPGEDLTDYVATRWYRAPELLVGDLSYGKAVDIWAVGCLMFEMITGDPLFPGDSDIDQLFHITKSLGNLTERHLEIFHKNPLFTGMRLPNIRKPEGLMKKHVRIAGNANDLVMKSLNLEAAMRPSCLQLMKHEFFNEGNFANNFIESLKKNIENETTTNPLLKSLAAHKENANKDKAKEKKKVQDAVSKTNEMKKKKEINNIEKSESISSTSHYHSSDNKKFNNTLETRRNSKNGIELTSSQVEKRGTTSTINVNRAQIEEKMLECNDANSRNENNNNTTKRTSKTFPKSKSFESERFDVKTSQRTPLDLSINTPGQNLPDIGCATNTARAHGHDVIKHKKVYTKKTLSKHDQISSLCPVAEKAPLKNKSVDESSSNEKLKKKERTRDMTDGDLTRKSGLHLPSVKGLDSKGLKTSPSRGSIRKPFTSTIPHIQNLDPFSSKSQLIQETSNGNMRFQRDGNLPAV